MIVRSGSFSPPLAFRHAAQAFQSPFRMLGAATCNLYAIMEARAEIARLAWAMTDRKNNQPPMPSV